MTYFFRFATIWLVCLFVTSVHAETHDAVAEFDDFDNPSANGWSYQSNGQILRNFVFNWNEPDFGPDQPGWEGLDGMPWAGWAIITEENADFSGFDVEPDSLVTHGSTDLFYAPSVANGDPASGSFSIAGSINNIRQLGRGGSWQLLHNNTVISHGEVNDGHTSDDPSPFEDGCGGVAGISAINYSDGDLISLKVLQNDFVNVTLTIETSANAGTDAAICSVAPSDKPHVAYYRFEEAMDETSIVDTISNHVHGQMENDGARSTDVPFSVVPQTGQPNLRAADFTEFGHALIDGAQFIFNGSNAGGESGGATLEWMMKVPEEEEIPNGHSAMFWSNADGGDADRFNLFWDASFTGGADSDRFVSGDFRSPGSTGPFDIGEHNNGNALEEGEWHHIAIVRNDNTPEDSDDFDFTWDWYIDGELSASHTKSTSSATPLEEQGWRIGGRQGGDAVRAHFDEIRASSAALTPDQFLISQASVAGDFDGNGVLDIVDINMLVGKSAEGSNDAQFDLDNDGLVNQTDINIWAKDLKNTWIGDANLDDEFNSSDLVTVFVAGKFETELDANWDEGDWTGDRRFSSSDLVAAFVDGGFEAGPRNAVQNVPEPKALWVLIPFGLLLIRWRMGLVAETIRS